MASKWQALDSTDETPVAPTDEQENRLEHHVVYAPPVVLSETAQRILRRKLDAHPERLSLPER